MQPTQGTTPEELAANTRSAYFELAFKVEDIDGWFDKVKQAGFEPQTPYVWSFGDSARSFAFFDDDHHIIQLWESPTQQGWG